MRRHTNGWLGSVAVPRGRALRRLGLGAKLQYVANKMREGVSLAEPMGDLNGSLAARIPYDAAFDSAENQHQPIATRRSGPAFEALCQLAASIYPHCKCR